MCAADPLSRGPFVILSPEQWGDLAPTNKHQLARALSEDSEVLYVNVAPSALGRLWPLTRVSAVGNGRLRVADSVGLPVRLRTRRTLSTHFATALIGARYAARSLSHKPTVALVYFPMPYRLLQFLGVDAIVYHCVDHHASFPGSSRVAAELLRWEQELAIHADLVLASSATLVDHLTPWRPDTHLLENVGDVDLFSRAGAAAAVRRAQSQFNAPVRAFFHGTLTAHKIDFDLLDGAAALPSRPLLHIVGDAADPVAAERMRKLAQRDNVVWEAAMNQQAVSERLADVDLLMMPYAVNDHTNFVFPIKLTEYLATGLPIVSSQLGSIIRFCGDLVEYVGPGRDLAGAFARAASEPAESPGRAARRQALVRGRTWAARANEIKDLIDTVPAR